MPARPLLQFIACSIAVFLASHAATTRAEAPLLFQQTPDASFDGDAWQWNSVTLSYRVKSRFYDWNTADPLDQLLGDKYLEVWGEGGFAHTFNLHEDSRFFVATLRAYRRFINKPGLGSWAGFGISFFDADGNQIGQVSEEILGQTSSPRGLGDGMKLYTLGCARPPGATKAILWLWNTTNYTHTFIDEFRVHDVYEMGAYNELASGTSLAEMPLHFTGTEFWLPADAASEPGIGTTTIWTGGGKGIPATPRTALALGSPIAPTIAYQTLRLEEQTAYQLAFSWQQLDSNATEAYVGVDYYSADGTWIKTSAVALPPYSSNPFYPGETIDVQLPSGAAYATLWMYVAPTDGIFAPYNIRLARH